MSTIIYKIDAFWDREAQVWVAESEDVPGLVTEASTIELLTDKLKQMIPELLFVNHLVSADYTGSISFELTSHRQELIQVA
ncbi:DUF1902 domain-containing protein [Aerosakkonema funiforme]|uniref:DUF1902 domain-containing protein n=1 Tax=Aerosakkonema funiforme TaxID=1246630 RepID=UPI0035BA79ED